MNNEVGTTGQQSRALTNPGTLGVQGPLSSDLVIPYFLLQQGSSELVKERKAQIGDFVRSTTGEKFGDPDKPAEIIFLHQPVTMWRVDQQIQGSDKWRFLKTFPRTTANEIMEFKFWGDRDGNPCDQSTPGALLHRRFKQFRVFAIMPSDIAAAKAEKEKAARGELPDPSKALTPILLSLQSTSGYPAGKDITTFYTKAASFQVPIYRYIVSMSCVLEKNDQGTFYCFKLTGTNPPKAVAKEDLGDVQYWAELVTKRADSLKVDEQAENQVGDTTAAPVSQENVREVC